VLTQNFEVIPAVDVLEGRAVRLRAGRREDVILEGGDPAELARRFEAEGASRLHLVDLDGAFSGTPTLGLLERVAASSDLPLQVGGGYRTMPAIAAALEHGADRVMVGTAALDRALLGESAQSFGARLVVAIDARDDRVAIDGWTRSADIEPVELARSCARDGVARLLVTATRRDGSLSGPDLPLLRDLLPAGLPVLAAGGISSVDDLVALRALGCEGAVVGSALLAGRFTLVEALADERLAMT
jgi:phosphoribosylformimino-5-aminoimidazole carboxamide ribotide isomerase